MFWIAAGLFLLTALASFHNAGFHYTLSNMIKWLEEQYTLLEKDNNYFQEAYELHNEHIPLLNQWLEESAGYGATIFVIQLANVVLLFTTMLGWHIFLLNLIVAIGMSGLCIGMWTTYRRRWIAEGICRGTYVNVEAMNIQATENSVDD